VLVTKIMKKPLFGIYRILRGTSKRTEDACLLTLKTRLKVQQIGIRRIWVPVTGCILVILAGFD
jgi:hypothetical protein